MAVDPELQRECLVIQISRGYGRRGAELDEKKTETTCDQGRNPISRWVPQREKASQ